MLILLLILLLIKFCIIWWSWHQSSSRSSSSLDQTWDLGYLCDHSHLDHRSHIALLYFLVIWVCRDPMNNNKDCRVGQLTTSAGSTSVERFPQDNSCNVLFLCQISNDCPWCWCHLRWVAPCVVFEWTKTAIWAPPPLEWRNTQNMYFIETLEFGDVRVNIWKRFE